MGGLDTTKANETAFQPISLFHWMSIRPGLLYSRWNFFYHLWWCCAAQKSQIAQDRKCLENSVQSCRKSLNIKDVQAKLLPLKVLHCSASWRNDSSVARNWPYGVCGDVINQIWTCPFLVNDISEQKWTGPNVVNDITINTHLPMVDLSLLAG